MSEIGPCKGGKEKLVQLGARHDEGAGETTRRDFLALVGYSFSAATLAACRAPVQKAIPMARAEGELIPGIANWYATTCAGCPASCSLLVKQRDGRPIKIEGNQASPLFGGATCATGQATVLSLYDDERLRGPLWLGRPATWKAIDRQVSEALGAAPPGKNKVAVLSSTLTSPSMRAILGRWRERSGDFQHVVYDAVSASALRAAGAISFGQAVVPHYAFDQARVIVGLDADFLGTWLSPVEFARQFARGRRSEGARPFHVQFEAGVSVTGTNADLRVPVAPSDLGAVAVALLARVARHARLPELAAGPDPVPSDVLDRVANELWRSRGHSLVVSGANDTAIQVAVNALNELLDNIGRTIDYARPSLQRQGDDAAVARLIDEMVAGEIHTLFLLGVNPAYDYPDAARFLAGLEKVALSISFADRLDETSVHAHAVCPDHHYLESWGDAEPVAGHFGLSQPLIAPLFDTRAAGESLLHWLGEDSDPYSFIRSTWRDTVFRRQHGIADFDSFWDRALEQGTVDVGAGSMVSLDRSAADWRAAAATLVEENRRARASRQPNRLELACFESVAMRDGSHANNPWLQELPDPITKVTWGNAAVIAPELATTLGVSEGDVVALTTGRGRVELPVFVQPGQEPRTVSVALGHGRSRVGKAGKGVGVNVFPLTTFVRGQRSSFSADLTLARTGRRESLAGSQTHFSMEERPIVLETTAEELASPSESELLPSLWSEQPLGEHSWGMAIDLDSCTGCSACVVACQAENNVPVVGKDQVQRNRIMHWIRIDRYYTGTRSLHQPMMCQHCGHAPCETVCPVLATTRSSEGLNQQVYNRCIGTRYCANNCPYKVRRFNWYHYTEDSRFDFNMTSPLGRMVLNPDVTVRSRGVMEKCSMCVQRIQGGKNLALRSGKPLADGDIRTACEQVCPTQAIVFGDLKDPASRAATLAKSRRAYHVLEELGTRPNVFYLKKIRHGTSS